MEKGKSQLQFYVKTTQEDTKVMKTLLARILNVPRIALSVFFAAGMSCLLPLVVNSGEMVTPLLIFSILLLILFLVLLMYTLYLKPRLLEVMARHQDTHVKLTFQAKEFLIDREREPVLYLSYKAIRGQYWYDDRYILFVDTAKCRELFCVPVEKETFDNLYILANTLEQCAKRKLIHFKTKRKGETG